MDSRQISNNIKLSIYKQDIIKRKIIIALLHLVVSQLYDKATLPLFYHYRHHYYHSYYYFSALISLTLLLRVPTIIMIIYCLSYHDICYCFQYHNHHHHYYKIIIINYALFPSSLATSCCLRCIVSMRATYGSYTSLLLFRFFMPFLFCLHMIIAIFQMVKSFSFSLAFSYP